MSGESLGATPRATEARNSCRFCCTKQAARMMRRRGVRRYGLFTFWARSSVNISRCVCDHARRHTHAHTRTHTHTHTHTHTYTQFRVVLSLLCFQHFPLFLYLNLLSLISPEPQCVQTVDGHGSK